MKTYSRKTYHNKKKKKKKKRLNIFKVSALYDLKDDMC